MNKLKYTPNEFEAILAEENPKFSSDSIDSAYLAVAIMNHLYFHPYQQHNNGDAFRHCLWSAIIARRTSPEWSKRWTDAHEGDPADKDIRKEMDRYNNSVGIDLVTKNPQIPVINIIDRCIQMGKDGVLKRRNEEQDGLIATTEEGFNLPSIFSLVSERLTVLVEFMSKYFQEKVQEKDDENNSALQRCIINDFEEGFNILVEVIDANAFDLYGESLLILCSRLEHGYKYAPKLLANGAKPNYQDPYYGVTALMKAAVYNNEKMVDILLPVSDKRIKSKTNVTAYDMAINEGHSEIAKKLI